MANIKVKLDIAGFYFSHTLVVAQGTTLQAAMDQVVARTGDSDTQFTYGTANSGMRVFVDQIAIKFTEAAPQPRQSGLDGYLDLTPGRYAARDETRVLTSAGVAELTWQYYANAAEFSGDDLGMVGRPLNREPDGKDPITRRIVEFSKFTLDQNCLVTWRLIAIMVAGDRLPAAPAAYANS